MSVETLNTRFGIGDQLRFRNDVSKLVVVEIDTPKARATLCLQGAHLMHWQPKQEPIPVLWLSRDARLAPGKAIRGGIPVCWPWFGPHPSEAGMPAHGFARSSNWEVAATEIDAAGNAVLQLTLAQTEETLKRWPHACVLTLTLAIGESLTLSLSTENTGPERFVIGEALHTYFQISDVASIAVSGLDGGDYWDTVGKVTLRKQEGSIRFASETDRVYIGSVAECVIEDEKLQRRIHIAKTGSMSTIVWSPWTEKAERMGDLGYPDGWRQMVCVESANAWDNVVTLDPGARHTLGVEYRVARD